MGATAFALFGEEEGRSVRQWRLSHELDKVALKAVSENSGKRQQSLSEVETEWGNAGNLA